MYIPLTSLASTLPILSSLVSRSNSNYFNAAHAAADVLNSKWYSTDTGLWEDEWWQSGNAVATLGDLDLMTVANQQASLQEFYQTSFSQAPNQQGAKNFLNGYYDDEGWWAMGWIRAFDATKNNDYLSMAASIFADMVGGYNATCGGHWWNKGYDRPQENNAIGNELFLQVAASLANRDSARKDYYLEWAQTEWAWFKNSGMINSSDIVNEGLNPSTCKDNGANGFTYVQGVILSGLVELDFAAPDQGLLDTAHDLAAAGISKLVTNDGILVDAGEPNSEGAMFKGAFVRGLMQLQAVSPKQAYVEFFRRNADTMLSNAKGSDGTFSSIWQGPFRPDLVNAASQTAALDLLIAAAAVS